MCRNDLFAVIGRYRSLFGSLQVKFVARRKLCRRHNIVFGRYRTGYDAVHE